MLNFFLGLGYALLTAILGKILFYVIYTSIETLYKYFNRNKLTKQALREVLTSMLENESFIKDAGKIMLENEKILAANKILEHPFLQRTIREKLEGNKFINRSEIENKISEMIIKG